MMLSQEMLRHQTGSFYVFGDEKDDAEIQLGSKWERIVHQKLERENLTVEPAGKCVEAFRYYETVGHERIGEPDFLILSNKTRICYLEVTGSRSPRDRFLIQFSKVKKFSSLEIPTFFTFYIDESMKIYWCEAVILRKYAPRIIVTNWSGRKVPQKVVVSPKEEWHRGIQSLIKVVRHLIEEAERYG